MILISQFSFMLLLCTTKCKRMDMTGVIG